MDDRPENVTTAAPSTQATVPTYALMLREIRSWGRWLLLLGVVQLVLGIADKKLSPSWGVLLLIVGLGSFFFREAAMLVVYGSLLGYAAIFNALSGQAAWIIIAMFQLLWATLTFRQFFRFRQTRADHAVLAATMDVQIPLARERAAYVFPWAGGVLGALALAGVLAIFAGTVIFHFLTQSAEPPGFLNWLDHMLPLAALGSAISLASLLSHYRHRFWVSSGLVTSTVVVLILVALSLLGRRYIREAVFQPVATPITGWKEFEGKGVKLRLPGSYEGGDPDYIQENAARLGLASEQAAEVIRQAQLKFAILALDTNVDGSGFMTNVLVAILEDQLLPAVTMDIVLDRVAKSRSGQDQRVVEQELVSFGDHRVGRIVTEYYGASLTIKELCYLVKSGGTLCLVQYTTSADEFEQRLPIFEQSIRTLAISPQQ